MNPGPILRIVSDLHLGEHGSRLHDTAGVEPLLEGVDRLVLNGDTLETRFLDLDPEAVRRKTAFEAWLAARAPRVVVITGNHDPQLGFVHHLDLADGAVLVTHGDTMFPEVAPWGWEAKHYGRVQKRLLDCIPKERRDTWETRLAVCKQAVLEIRDLSPRFPGSSSHPWARRLRFLHSIRRIDRILRCWREAPSASAALAETHRPAARVVVVGHTHRPGVWPVRGRWVVNTGSAVPPMGARAVDLVGRELIVRRWHIRRGRAGLGDVVARIDLDAPFPGRGPRLP